MLSAMFQLICQAVSEEEIFKKLANQKQELPVEGHVW
jgi:hypothetical protein